MKIQKQFTFLTLLLILILFSGCIGDVGRIETHSDQYIVERNNSLELLDFLDEFTSGNSWETGQDNIHIKWLTPIHIIDDKSEKYVDAFLYKKGQVFLTLDSTFTDFYNRDRAYPVPWSIHMYGARTMYFNCKLMTDTTGVGGTNIEEYLEQKKALIRKYYFKRKKDVMRYGLPQYTWCVVKAKSGREINFLHEGLYMNNVCDEAIYFNCTGSDQIPFPEEFFEYHKDTSKYNIEQ